MKPGEVEQRELEVLLEAIKQRHGYDFHNYARPSLRRRFLQRKSLCGVAHLSDLIPKVFHDEDFVSDLLQDLSITVTEMFRDPHFYREFREEVIPTLATYPFIKIWHAGCATGQEAYSVAIFLHEAGLLERTQIYASDFNNRSLETAKRGIYSLESMESYAASYAEAGGQGEFKDYYRAQRGAAKLDPFLGQRITFANHNLASDGVFGEMHVILCRNVLIYFDRTLQDRVLSRFRDSLVHRGFLCLGDKESVEFSEVSDAFEAVVPDARIFRRRSPVVLPQTGGLA